MSRFFAWMQAARWPSQLYIFLPLLVGQAFFVLEGNAIDWGSFALVHAFGLFMQLYIIFGNDVGDLETDRLNHTFTVFSGGSRVLADGKIAPHALKLAAVLAAALTMATALVSALLFGRYLAPLLAAIGLALLYMYSFAPFRFSYRGGGELLQTIGVGIVLPLYGYYGQKGALAGFPVEMLAVILPSELACAVATALPDEPSDRQSRKGTAVVRFGRRWAQVAIFGLNAVGIAAFYHLFHARLSSEAMMRFIAVPVLATLLLPLFHGGRPGERRLMLFVGLAITATLGLLGALCALPIALG